MTPMTTMMNYHTGLLSAARNTWLCPTDLDANDMQFAAAQGFNAGDQFYNYLKGTALTRCTEEGADTPQVMSVGLHCRVIGRPGRFASLKNFCRLRPLSPRQTFWFCRRIDIARHWREHHPFGAA